MSRWPTERPRHAVWLGPQGWASARRRQRFGITTGWGEATVHGHPWDPAQPPAPEALFEAWCAAHPGSICELLLSAHLLHHWVIGGSDTPGAAPAARDSLASLQARARRHWATFHGRDALGWPVAVGEAAGAVLSCAPDGWALATLQTAAQRHSVRLRTVQPAWAAAWAACLPRRAHARLAVFEPGAVTWLGIEAGRCHALVRQTVHKAQLASADGLRELLQQAPLPATGPRTGAPCPWQLLGHGQGVHRPAAFWLRGAAADTAAVPPAAGSAPAAPVPHSAWPQPRATAPGGTAAVPEFVTERGASGWAWALAAAGVLVAAAAVLDFERARSHRDAARERLAAAEAGAARATRAPRLAATLVNAPNALNATTATGASPAAALAADDRAALAAQRVAQRLRHPWPEVMSAIEQAAAAGGLQWLSFAHEPPADGLATLQLGGLAADAASLDAVVEALAAQTLLRDVNLRRQDAEPRAAADALRFELTATLRPAATQTPPVNAAAGMQ